MTFTDFLFLVLHIALGVYCGWHIGSGLIAGNGRKVIAAIAFWVVTLVILWAVQS